MSQEVFYFNLHPVNFLIISGICQNYIISLLLFLRRADNVLPNRILSIAIFLVNLHLSYLMILDLNLDNMYPFLLWFPYSYLTAIGPLVFAYTRSLTDSEFKVTVSELTSFFPVVIELALQIIQIVYSGSKGVMFYNTPLNLPFSVIIYVFALGSIFYYLRLSLERISNHENRALKNFSNLKEITLSWLQKLVVYYRILWIVWIPFAIVFLLIFRFQLQFLMLVAVAYVLILIITYLTYWIGLEGLRQTNPMINSQKSFASESKAYANLSHEHINTYKKKIEQLMSREKLYLNETLSLREFSNEMTADPNLISYILNSHLHKNFFEFVNSYRVEEVKNRLGKPEYKHLTILAIAMQCGFNSKTSFNRIFKQMTGLTPSQFKKRIR